MAIILSYSRKDEAAVKALAQGLEAAKREVWFDHDLGGGDAWWDSILENIRAATVFLFALSDASLHSKPCRLELDYALDLGRPVVPVQVGPVTSFRASPLAKLQIIGYSPDNAQSGFTVLAAVDEAARRARPLPDPLPAPPPIPFAYLLALGRQIDSMQLSMADQVAVIDQLRRALGEETDESVRQDILSMLKNLNTKPWMTKWTEREIAALLYAHAPRPPLPKGEEQPAPRGHRPDGEPSAAPEPGQPLGPEPDPREWFAERLEQLLQQQTAARATEQTAEQTTQQTAERKGGPADPPAWRPRPDAAAHWTRTFERIDSPAGAAGPSAGAQSFPGAGRSPGTQSPPGMPGPTWTSPPASAAPQQTAAQQTAPPQMGPQSVTGQPQPHSTAPRSTAPSGPWAPPSSAPTAPAPPAYWPLSIVSLLFSLLFGGIAMYFSRQVGRRYRAGDVDGARRASGRAKVWGIVGIVVGVVGVLVLGALAPSS